MKIFVGLGNPGKEYEGTRHNVGFSVLNKISDYIGGFSKKDTKNYSFVQFDFKGEKIFLFYPLKFMNLSGEALKEFCDYYKYRIEDVYVIHDDMDLEPGIIKLKHDGKSAGHKGIQNIIDMFKTDKFNRIKVGIGKPKFNSIDFVLGKPKDPEEMNNFIKGIDKAFSAVIEILNENFEKAMNKFNALK